MSFSDKTGGWRSWAVEGFLVLAVFLVALIPRVLDLDVFITADELKWTCRSANFHAALTKGTLTETFQKGHPGVITMWLGGLGQPVDPESAWARACYEIPLGKLVNLTTHETLATLGDRLFAGRRPVAVFVALGIAGIYLLAARLFDRRIAFLSGLLVALDPLYLAHSRVLHLDAVTTTLMTLSLLSLLVYLLRRPASFYLILSGLMAGLATLNKSPAGFMAPFTALLVGVIGLRRGQRPWPMVRSLVLWGLAAAAIFVALWPVMWVNPVLAMSGVLTEAIGYASSPHEGLNYFWGAIRPDPGPFFYPVAWLFRTTPLVLLGCLAVLPRFARREKEGQHLSLLAMGAYVLLFGLFMTTGAKKFDRYLLPIFPTLDLMAAVGLVALCDWVARILSGGGDKETRRQGDEERLHSSSSAHLLVSLLTFSLQALLVLAHHPYYLSYYNPLLGGGRVASRVLLVGWGEGIDQAARYLNQKQDAQTLQVATRYRSAFGPLFQGQVLEMDDYDPATVDYFLFYQNQIQRDLDPELIRRYLQGGPAEYVVTIHGINYVWLYANDNYVAPMAYIEANARPEEDVILVRGDSLFAQRYQGVVPLIKVDPDGTKDEVLAALKRAFREHKRVWYVRYVDVYPRPILATVDYELTIRTFRLAQRQFPDVTVGLYQALEPPAFGGEPALYPLAVDFGDQLGLTGYGFVSEPIQWGRELGVTLTWQAREGMTRDYTAFLHLIGPDGHRWAQVDQPITDRDLVPTSSWAPGTTVRDHYHLAIPAGTPPGRYKLLIGVYDSQTGSRLPATLGGEELPDKAYALDVEVARSLFIPAVEDLDLAQRVEWPLTDWMELLGYSLMGSAEGGKSTSLTLAWRVLKQPPGDYRLRLELRDVSGALVAQGTFDPAGPAYPTSQWEPGEVVRGWYDLLLNGRALAGEGQLYVNLVDPAGQPLWPESVPVGPLGVAGPQRIFELPGQVQHPLRVDLGGQVRLLGYHVAERRVKPGDTIHLTLYWQAQKLMDVSYTVFVHLLDESGQMRGQVDTLPVGGARPTNSWLAGEVTVDTYKVTVAPDAPPGRYTFAVGMYDLATLQRLPAFDANGQRLPDDRVLLGQVEVRP